MVTNPFREALSEIQGTSWLDEAARSSLRAASSKFYGPAESLLKVELRSPKKLGAYDAAVVTMAVQDATAKLAHVIRDPSREWTQVRQTDREAALLTPRGQVGGMLLFGFSSPRESSGTMFPEHDLPALAEIAARELCEVLPSEAEDDAAIDAVLGQRITVRNAVSDIVTAVSKTAADLTLELASHGRTPIGARLTTQHAAVLQDSLEETRTDRRTQTMAGRLDGVRTRRRIFYLELENGEEIHGAVGPEPELMDSIRRNLGRHVIATIESARVETVGGRVSHPTHRLLALEAAPGLFDEHE